MNIHYMYIYKVVGNLGKIHHMNVDVYIHTCKCTCTLYLCDMIIQVCLKFTSERVHFFPESGGNIIDNVSSQSTHVHNAGRVVARQCAAGRGGGLQLGVAWQQTTACKYEPSLTHTNWLYRCIRAIVSIHTTHQASITYMNM